MGAAMSSRGSRSGFTLVEVLVALTIGLFLTAGMVQMYVANRQTFRFSDSLSRIQENGRYAIALIARDMRMADFWGCSRGNRLRVLLNGGCTTPDAFSTNAIAGTDGMVGAPDQPDSITLRGSVGTGLIVAAGATATQLRVEGTVSDAEAVLGDTNDRTGDIVLISDCRGGDLFQATAISGGNPADIAFAAGTPTSNPPGPPGNAIGTFAKSYDQSATVRRWREVIYSIRRGLSRQNALFIQENACAGGVLREAVEGVVNMQINYGEDTNDDGVANRYVAAANVADWDRLVSIRVSLLLASAEDNLVEQAQQISFAGQTFTAADRRLYQVITATFAIRNRPLQSHES
jgi:type IV pilus assembly protein PilW